MLIRFKLGSKGCPQGSFACTVTWHWYVCCASPHSMPNLRFLDNIAQVGCAAAHLPTMVTLVTWKTSPRSTCQYWAPWMLVVAQAVAWLLLLPSLASPADSAPAVLLCLLSLPALSNAGASTLPVQRPRLCMFTDAFVDDALHGGSGTCICGFAAAAADEATSAAARPNAAGLHTWPATSRAGAPLPAQTQTHPVHVAAPPPHFSLCSLSWLVQSCVGRHVCMLKAL